MNLKSLFQYAYPRIKCASSSDKKVEMEISLVGKVSLFYEDSEGREVRIPTGYKATDIIKIKPEDVLRTGYMTLSRFAAEPGVVRFYPFLGEGSELVTFSIDEIKKVLEIT